jgi:hypothetical protein
MSLCTFTSTGTTWTTAVADANCAALFGPFHHTRTAIFLGETVGALRFAAQDHDDFAINVNIAIVVAAFFFREQTVSDNYRFRVDIF